MTAPCTLLHLSPSSPAPYCISPPPPQHPIASLPLLPSTLLHLSPSSPAPYCISPPPPQLQHTLTKKYLVVNTTLTSRVENTSLRVELRSENTQGCIFKILPRYKVRSVGDVVREWQELVGMHICLSSSFVMNSLLTLSKYPLPPSPPLLTYLPAYLCTFLPLTLPPSHPPRCGTMTR